jgi:long-subunit fatty acid transport protein
MDTIARSALSHMSTPRTLLVALSLSALSAVLVPLTEEPARASGFLADQFGSDHGHPAMGNPYSVYFNPGAMAAASGTSLTLDGVFGARSLSFNRASSALNPTNTDPTYQTVNTGQATLFNVLASPYLAMVTDFGGSNFRLGIAGYVPFGGEVSWQKSPSFLNYPGAPGAYDGPQRWASISTLVDSVYGTAALGYRVEPLHLGIGASFSVIRSSVTDTRAHNLDGSDTIFSGGQITEGRSYLDVSGIQVGAAAGLYWEPSTKLHLGASYTSQPNFGTMRLKGTYKQYVLGNTISQSADLLQAYPDIVRAGATWRVAPDAEVRLDGSWQRWSVLTNQCVVTPGAPCGVSANGASTLGPSQGLVLQNVPRDMQDSYKVRLGGAYWITPPTEVFASFAYETSPLKSAYEDPLVFDSTRLYGTLGVHHAFTQHVAAMASYTYVYLLPVTVTDSAYGTYQSPTRTPSENGSYSSSLYIVDVALSYTF